MLYFTLFLLEKSIHKANKKDKKYLEKTLKTWKNHGKIMEFCWSAAVGTLSERPAPQVELCNLVAFGDLLLVSIAGCFLF